MEIDVQKASFIINRVIKKLAGFVFVLTIISFSLSLDELWQTKTNGFCLDKDCINYFFSFFENILNLFKFLVAITTVLLAWLTVQIYLSTYLTTHKNNLNIQMVNQKSTYLSHFKFFNEILENYLNGSKYLTKRSFDKFIFYNYVFLNPQLGDFSISDRYKKSLFDINSNIILLNNNLPRKLGYVSHRDFLINSLSEMGITVPKCERKDFLMLEKELYLFFNNINKYIDCEELEVATYNAYE